MAFKFMSIALGIVHIATAMSAIRLQDLEVADDTMSVGSYIRETRATAPENFHKTYENEADGTIGYSRKKSGGGKKGYQHFDSYHKKAGDNYEFEKQDSFGLEDEGQDGAYSHNHERKDAFLNGSCDAVAGCSEKVREPPAEDDEEDESRKSIEGREDRSHEELKAGASDGNGGEEAIGHDPKDYILPEKYTYGSGETYDF